MIGVINTRTDYYSDGWLFAHG